MSHSPTLRYHWARCLVIYSHSRVPVFHPDHPDHPIHPDQIGRDRTGCAAALLWSCGAREMEGHPYCTGESRSSL